MAVATQADDLARFVQLGRVHFETERERADGSPVPVTTGAVVRLFAMHEKGAHEVPSCPTCRRLAMELRNLAEAAISAEPVDAEVEVGPFVPVLYDSRQVPGRDEVVLSVHLRPRQRGPDGQGTDDRYIKQLGRGLKRLGVAEH